MNAIRTFVSFDELAKLLRVGDGRKIEAVSLAPVRWGLGIEVLVTGDGLPEPTTNLGIHNSPGWAKLAIEEWSGIKGRREGYTPATPAVVESDPARWPAFPGQELDCRSVAGAPSETDGDYSGGQDINTGGPR